MTYQWNLTGTYDPGLDRQVQSVTITSKGRSPKTAREDHHNFTEIVQALTTGDLDVDELYELFDVQKVIQRKTEHLSERLTYRDDKIFFDGDEVNARIADQVRDLIHEGKPYGPVVAFWEKMMANPSQNSKNQLWEYIDKYKISVFPDGDFVGYKGCSRHEDGILYSTHAGHAIVDGVEMNGYVPNVVGSIVEMPRSEVKNDPHSACSSGLHVGTYSFAGGFANNGSLLIVKINPRDVVSVPHDVSHQKIRVCRYKVIDEDIKREFEETVVGYSDVDPEAVDEAVESLKAVYAEKVSEDDGVIKVGSHVRYIGQIDATEYTFEGTVVALEDYYGDLTIQRPDGSQWVADRHNLEIIKPVTEILPPVTISVVSDPLPGTATITQYDLTGNHIEKVLADAIGKAKKAKKSAVLLREMKAAGYEPKYSAGPQTASTTVPENWQPIPGFAVAKGKPELPEDHPVAQNPTEEEFENLIQEAKRRKKGLLTYGRSRGWLFVADPSERNSDGVKIRTNWLRKNG